MKPVATSTGTPPVDPPAVMIHSLPEARLALAAAQDAGLPSLLLLSAPSAGCFMGPAWWRALVTLASSETAGLAVLDLLDCGAAAGRAMEALRIGQHALVLSPACPQRAAVLERARPLRAIVRSERPPALDLGARDAGRILEAWVNPARRRDKPIPVG